MVIEDSQSHALGCVASMSISKHSISGLKSSVNIIHDVNAQISSVIGEHTQAAEKVSAAAAKMEGVSREAVERCRASLSACETQVTSVDELDSMLKSFKVSGLSKP